MAASAHWTFTPMGQCFKKVNPSVSGTGSLGALNLRAPTKGSSLVCRASPKYKGTLKREQKLSDLIAEKVSEATDVCAGNESSDECKVAWDEVEEVSQAKAHFRQRAQNEDPLEQYCKENPETDECRVYED